jgi:hypothetical protein
MSADWDLDKVLGSGANGTAYLAFRKDYMTGQVRASSEGIRESQDQNTDRMLEQR